MTETLETRFDRLILLVGKLNYMWTNTESLLIHLIAGLSGTNKDVAVIIFLTLNTTRARIDLVERLAKMEGRPAEIRDPILEHTQRLSKLSSIRNRYNHCIYSFDAESGNPKTILMRIADRKTDIKLGRSDTVDEQAIKEIEDIVAQLSAANRDIWRLISTLGFPV
ncbi:hypothetical protein [Ruegeria profundi]|uniref:Uncharacterized protein n=1 Tax=Ruegeria profundi TaxID=1685378 RepID=A0A0X3U571_9RHOB|nr:hypothetical protein [Ruegeria profundi]KUJ82301.1 hypothetical protein AVO44_03330 [Ruegeria profundi]MCA0927603.1 hypothetical protein [Ruegeria profundi]